MKSPARAAVWTPGSVVRRSGLARRRAPPHVQLGGIVLRREENIVAYVEDRRDLETRRRDRLTVQRDPTGVLALPHEHEPSVRQAIRHTGDRRLPVLRGVVEERLRLPGVGIDLEHEPALLISGQHQQGERASIVPRHLDEVREGVAVPVDVHTRSVEPEDRERHVGVVRAGLRVPNGSGWRVRIHRRGDVPHAHGSFVHARGRDPLPVRRPPEPPVAIQLLRCGELRDPPMDVRVVVVGEDPARPSGPLPSGKVLHVESAVHDVGHAASRGVGPDVERSLGGVLQRAGPTRGEVRDVHPTSEHERGEGQPVVCVVGRDPRHLLAHPLAPVPLVLGELLPPVHRRGIEDQPLLPGLHIEHPEAAFGIVPGLRSDERHPRPVLGHCGSSEAPRA